MIIWKTNKTKNKLTKIGINQKGRETGEMKNSNDIKALISKLWDSEVWLKGDWKEEKELEIFGKDTTDFTKGINDDEIK